MQTIQLPRIFNYRDYRYKGYPMLRYSTFITELQLRGLIHLTRYISVKRNEGSVSEAQYEALVKEAIVEGVRYVFV